MEYGAILLGAYAVITIIRYVLDYRNDREMLKINEDVQDVITGIPPGTEISLGRRIYISVISRLYSRTLETEEFCFTRGDDESELEVGFYVARRILFIDLLLDSSQGTQLKKIQFECDNGEIKESFGIRTKVLGNMIRIRLLAPKLPAVSKITLFLDQFTASSQCEVRVGVQRGKYSDFEIMKSALEQYSKDDYYIAFETFQEYLHFSDNNPHVYFHLANACEILKKESEFEVYLIKAMVYGLGEALSDRYRHFVSSRKPKSVENIRVLQGESQDWTPGKHHGVIALLCDKEYLTGLNDWYLKKVREVLVIRRPVAARMLTKVGFDFQGSEILLHTECRIIKEDDSVIDLPLERFVVGDSDERNIYITTDTEKSASWILPDISSGDIIESCYHILGREGYTIGQRKVPLAILSLIGHVIYPTFIGTTKFKESDGQNLQYSLKDRGIDIDMENSQDMGYKTNSFSIHRFSPVTNTNYYYASYHNNPVVACANRRIEWPEISQAVQFTNFGKLEDIERLPSPLYEFVECSQTPREAVEKAFYWVRDKLKYASTGSAVKLIGKKDRAQSIIQAGVADCKDKSFLLFMVCKQLELETQFVAVSYKHNIIFEDLPSDQFDHVFIRVRIERRWFYLDAANRSAVFCSCPPPYQGANALILNEESRIEQIAIDSPEENTVSITETFDKIDGDWLYGTFHLAAKGNVARMVDENWKAQSLTALDNLQGAQAVLRNFLPCSVLKSYDRISHTSHTDSFEVLGVHNRCQLSQVGNRLVGKLEWNEPTMPIGYWRNCNHKKSFMFLLPTRIEIISIFSGQLMERISDISDPFSLTNELCEVKAEMIQKEGEIILSHKVTIKKRFVEPGLLDLVPSTMEAVEKGFQAALIISQAKE